jgi:hypothetical protein
MSDWQYASQGLDSIFDLRAHLSGFLTRGYVQRHIVKLGKTLFVQQSGRTLIASEEIVNIITVHRNSKECHCSIRLSKSQKTIREGKVIVVASSIQRASYTDSKAIHSQQQHLPPLDSIPTSLTQANIITSLNMRAIPPPSIP